MRNPVTSQTVHSECPRPQPREAKTVSQFRMNLIQPSKGIERNILVVRRSLSLVVLHDEHGHWIKKKRLRKQFREEMMQGRLPGRAVCLEAMKKYPHASKWQDIKDKIRNMTISDARK